MPVNPGELVPTSLAKLLPLIQAQCMASLVWTQERVILWARENPEEPFHPQGDQYLRIRPRDQKPEAPVVGGGRSAPLVTRTINVTLWSRCGLDEGDRDAVWLDDPTLGLIAGENAILNALMDFHVNDTQSPGLLCFPLQPKPVKTASKEREEPEWGRSEMDFDVTFTLGLATSYQ